MNDPFETDPQKRSEIVECFYWSLMNGWDIPRDIVNTTAFPKTTNCTGSWRTWIRRNTGSRGGKVPCPISLKWMPG